MEEVGQYPINAERTLKRSDLGVELVRILSSEGHRIFSRNAPVNSAHVWACRTPTWWKLCIISAGTSGLSHCAAGSMPSLPSIPGVTPTHEFEIAMALVNPAVISHWSALHHYGLTEQIPRKVFVLTTVTASVPRLRGTRASQANGGYRVGETTTTLSRSGRSAFSAPKRYGLKMPA